MSNPFNTTSAATPRLAREETLTPPLWRDLALLLLACAALWGWTYGLWDLWGPDEPRYVQIARELLGRANWMVLTVLGDPYKEKPPLPFWIFAGMIKLAGGAVNSWAVRFPPVAFGTATVLLTYLIGRRRLGRRAGWLAAWLLLTAPLFVMEVPAARLDILLTGFIALAIWAWLAAPAGTHPLSPGRAALFWLGLSGAFFIKGPVVWVVVLGSILLESWRARAWRPFLTLRPLWGLPAMLALVGTWYLSQYVLLGGQFAESQLRTATLDRLINPEMHAEAPWFFLLNLFGDGFPVWSVVLALALASLWRTRRTLPAGWPALRPILIWAVWPFLFFSIIPSKREQYLLPAYPAIALLTAWFLDRHWDREVIPRWLRRLVMAVLIATGVGLVLGLLVLFSNAASVKLPETLAEELAIVRQAPFFAPRMAAVLLAGLALAASAILWRRASRVGQAAGLLATTLFFGLAAGLGIGHPLLNPAKSPRPVGAAIAAQAAPGEPVGAVGSAFRPQYQVYGSYRLIKLDDAQSALIATSATLPRVLIVETRGKRWDKLKPVVETRLGYRRAWRAHEGLDSIGVYTRGK